MIKACVIGLGQRGWSLLRHVLLKNSDIQIISVCDLYEDRVADALTHIREAGGDACGFSDWREALNAAGLDAVFIFSERSSYSSKLSPSASAALRRILAE